MRNSKNLLDISDISSWMITTSNISLELISEKIRDHIKNYGPDDMFSDTMSFFFESCNKCGQDRDYEEWCAELDDAFMNRYSHIKAFHSCRTFLGFNSYKDKGIQIFSRDLLRELAKVAFSEYATQEEIGSAVKTHEIPDFEEGIFLFTDSKSPLDRSCNHYLQSGSENLQALAIELNIDSRGILASQGQSYLIECEVPLVDVHIAYRYELWRKFITCFFKTEAGNDPPTSPFDFCLKVSKHIGPESIKEFHLIDDKKLICYSPRH